MWDDPPDEFEPLLASDLAAAVRADFDEVNAVGADAQETAGAVFARYRGLLADPQDGPVVLLALAVLQHRAGKLLPAVREAAVDLIDSGEAARAHRAIGDSSLQRQRVELLQQLRDTLAPPDEDEEEVE